MLASAETLWRSNQEYVNRLLRARNYLDLLEQLVIERGSAREQDELLPALQYTGAHLNSLSEEHRGWCYAYFYDSPDTKRIVQTPGALRRAVSSFGHMYERHHAYFYDLEALLDDLPRPPVQVTRVPNGDLWEMVQIALHDLVDFNDQLSPV